MFVTGLAYCGTSNNAAIQKLLHFAVSGAPRLPHVLGRGSPRAPQCCSTEVRCRVPVRSPLFNSVAYLLLRASESVPLMSARGGCRAAFR